ncbi:MAG: imidazole glycerol phosphate synthase subunit HisH [Endomicrobiales bacterium]
MSGIDIAVIDYGMGNLRSVAKALELSGARVTVTAAPGKLASARAVVFPGVGSFGPALENLRRTGLDEAVRDVIAGDKPFLGICLGFQLLFSKSEEDGKHAGLGIVPGDVVRFAPSRGKTGRKKALKVPHMGWNRVKSPALSRNTMFGGIPENSYFYFVHSYYGRPEDDDAVAGTTEYGVRFCSAVIKGRTWACQFHPEKSGAAGLKLLGNFVKEVKQC